MKPSEDENVDFEQVLNSLPMLVFFTDADGTIFWENRSCTDLLAPAGTPSGKRTIGDLFPDDREDFFHDIRLAISSGETKNGIIRRIDTPHSGAKSLKFCIIPCKDRKEKNSRVMIFALDVTDQVEMNRLRQDAYEQIEKNIEQFATLGDHLRNPVAIIIGLCDMLDDKAVSHKIIRQGKEIDRIVAQIDKGWIDSEKIRMMLKKYYDVGIRGTHELVARAIHEEYSAQQQNAGLTPQTKPSMRPWNELSHHLQEANLKQADDICKKLQVIHCAIGISTDANETLFEFTSAEIEMLAQMEHERWMDEHLKRGWVQGPETNEKLRMHDCLMPWEPLPEQQKEKDRNAIRTLPGILAKVQLKIVRFG